MAGVAFGTLAKARPLRRTDGGRDGLSAKSSIFAEEDDSGSDDPEAKMWGNNAAEDEESGSDDPEAKMWGNHAASESEADEEEDGDENDEEEEGDEGDEEDEEEGSDEEE